MSDVVATSQPGLTDKYHPYPEYKDSGVEWYRSIPADWGVERLKFSVRKLESGTSVNAMDTPAGLGQVGVLKTSAVYTGEFRRSENKAVLESDLARVSCPVKNGCLVVSRMNTPDLVGAAGLVTEDAESIYLPDRLWQVHVTDGAAKFIHYWTLTPEYRNQVRLVCTGTSSSMQNLSQEQFLNFLIPALGEDEKNSIAAFLDYETSRIDQLIAQQQRLIELLKEKRQAVISHAVTKGLNPNAPMKDSGVEWLGQVPEHWIVRRLKHHIISMDQGWSPQCEARLAEEDEFGVMKVGCVNGGVFRFSEHKALPAELEPKTEYRLKKGQLLVSRANTRELVGSAAVVDADYEQLLLCDKLYRIKLSSDASPEFVALLLGTSAYRGQIELSASGASDSMQNIGQSTIKELPIAVPPMDESNDILKYVAARLCTFNCLNNQLQQQNLLLQERRTALISAAVTGKIDLRGWTPPAEEAAA